jgi:hypothetical protein
VPPVANGLAARNEVGGRRDGVQSRLRRVWRRPFHPPGKPRTYFERCPLTFQNELPETGVGSGEQASVWIAYDHTKHKEPEVEDRRKKATLGVLEFRVASPKLAQLIRLQC